MSEPWRTPRGRHNDRRALVSLATMAVGNLGALSQTKVRRLLGCSSGC